MISGTLALPHCLSVVLFLIVVYAGCCVCVVGNVGVVVGVSVVSVLLLFFALCLRCLC